MVSRLFTAWLLLGWGAASAVAQINTGIVDETTAQRHGLTRTWWAQAQVDRAQSRLQSITLHYGTILAVTDHGTVQAFDAETGKALWTQQVGRRNFPTYAAGANSAICAVVNGSTLYMYELETGKFYDQREVEGVPSGPPAVSRDTVFVPTHRQLVEAHKLIPDDRPLQSYAALGHPIFTPYVAKDSIVVPTESGDVYSISIEGGTLNTMTAFGGLGAGVTYAPPYYYCASVGGYVYAIHETNGRHLWKRSVGDAVRELPVVIKDAVYVTPVGGGLFRLKTSLGQEDWFTPFVKRLLAASPKRLYALDPSGRIVVLDAATGARFDTLPIYGNKLSLVNYQNDRLYLANDTGLIQCLHEADLKEPVNYLWEPRQRVSVPGGRLETLVKPPAKEKAGKGDKAPMKPSEPAAGAADPFGGGADPAGGGAAMPAPGAAMPGPAKGGAAPVEDPFSAK